MLRLLDGLLNRILLGLIEGVMLGLLNGALDGISLGSLEGVMLWLLNGSLNLITFSIRFIYKYGQCTCKYKLIYLEKSKVVTLKIR